MVVYNPIARKVLRIIKADRGQHVPAEADRAEIERRLKFEKLVIVSETLIINPSVPDAPNWRISVFEKRLHEAETS